MKHRWLALLMVLASSVMAWSEASAQQTPPTTQRASGSLLQNEPNPFNPETTIRFTLGLEGNPPVCRDPNRIHRVSLTIYNILGQLVATPIIQGGLKAGEPVNGLLLGCGEHKAFWDGTIRGTGQKAPSMAYVYILAVDGEKPIVKRMMIKK